MDSLQKRTSTSLSEIRLPVVKLSRSVVRDFLQHNIMPNQSENNPKGSKENQTQQKPADNTKKPKGRSNQLKSSLKQKEKQKEKPNIAKHIHRNSQVVDSIGMRPVVLLQRIDANKVVESTGDSGASSKPSTAGTNKNQRQARAKPKKPTRPQFVMKWDGKLRKKP